MKSLRPDRLKYSKAIFHTLLISILTVSLASYAGAVVLHQDPGKTVKIGLLIPDSLSVAAIHGAELAVILANRNGGYNGTRFELVVRSMEGPWGTGSKQAIDLIFNEKVWVLLGSHDGRNAHLVEQAATKAIVPFVSAWPGDPTLTQAFVPWVFNCVPNDSQQAESLCEEICLKRNFKRIITVSDKEYDSEMALSNFLKKIRLANGPVPVQFQYEDKGNIRNLLNEIVTADAECIVLFCNPSSSAKLYSEIIERDMKLPIFSTHYLLNEDLLSEEELYYFDKTLMITAAEWADQKLETFRNEYLRKYRRSPGMAAATAFDGMNLIIEAVRSAGSSDREMIQKSLEKIIYTGVTGTISFDDMGNRNGPFKIRAVKNGMPFMAD